MKTLSCIIASCFLFALSFLSPVFGQKHIKVNEQDKRGNDVVVYRDAVTGVAKRVWHNERLVLSVFDSSLIASDGSFVGMHAVDEAKIERIIPRILGYYDRLLKIKPAEFTKRQIETDGEKWYITCKQVYKGIPVYRAEVGLTIDAFGQIISIGSNSIPDLKVSTMPSVTETGAIGIALQQVRTEDTDSLSIRGESELVIYAKRSDTEVKSYLAYRVDAMNHTKFTGKRIFVDAHSGLVVEETNLFREGNKTIQGTISGKYWPKDVNSTQVTETPEYYHQLKVTNVLGQTVGTDYIDSNGNYSITWNGASAIYWLNAAIRGSYAEVTNVPNSVSFFVSGTTTYNRQFAADQDAYNLYFHMNKIHDWFKGSPFNYNGMDYRMEGTAYAGAGINGEADGNDISFGTQNGNLWHSQGSVIYHEYTHNTIYHIYGNNFIGDNSGDEASAMDEGLADYFATSLADDPSLQPLVQRNVSTPDLDMNDFRAQANQRHRNGLILAGACWDLQKDGGISQNDARKLAFKAMQLIPRPDMFSEFVDNVILQDDNNGKLCDGTPHYNQIIAAFQTKHGIVPTLNVSMTVTINGPDVVEPYESNTWTADVCGGSGSTSYQWYVKYEGSSTWSSLGSSQNQSHTFYDEYTYNELKVAVTRGSESDEDTQVVFVSDGGLFKRGRSEIAQIPEQFELQQNYPNPFNPATEIKYGLPENGQTTLEIFNMRGQKVRTLVNEKKSAGYHHVVWDGRNDFGNSVASGVYFYRIYVLPNQTGALPFESIKKMTFLR